MTRDDQTLLLVAVGLYLYSRYSSDVVPSLQRGGASLFDALHNDKGHQQDLPRPERMDKQPPIVKARFDKLVQYATEAGFPDPMLAAAIGMAESGGKHDAITKHAGGTGAPGYQGKEHSVGLWQINILAHPQYTESYLLDPINNARAAYAISKQGLDWRPWTTFNTGAYKRYVP